MDRSLIDALRAALLCHRGRNSVGAVVLNGTDPGFCAGSDLKFIGGLDLERCRVSNRRPAMSRV